MGNDGGSKCHQLAPGLCHGGGPDPGCVSDDGAAPALGEASGAAVPGAAAPDCVGARSSFAVLSKSIIFLSS